MKTPPEGTKDQAQGSLSHLDERGQARMVDVGDKPSTRRKAVASSWVSMKKETLAMIVDGRAPKGDVLATARIAGIMAAKRTGELVPMCHPIFLTHVSLDIEPRPSSQPDDDSAGVEIRAVCETVGQTGVEMEALTAASVAALTVYDMCKAVDRGMVIRELMLLEKEGGASGTWVRG